MKIGITGTHGSGKTTYAIQMAAQLKIDNPTQSVYLLQENIPDSPYPVNKQTSVESQLWITSDQMKRELEAVQKYDIVVCDRTLIDSVIYGNAAGFSAVSSHIYEFVKHYMNTYDELYFIDGSKRKLVFTDGIRDTDLDFRDKVNTMFLNMFSTLHKEKYIESFIIVDDEVTHE